MIRQVGTRCEKLAVGGFCSIYYLSSPVNESDKSIEQAIQRGWREGLETSLPATEVLRR